MVVEIALEIKPPFHLFDNLSTNRKKCNVTGLPNRRVFRILTGGDICNIK